MWGWADSPVTFSQLKMLFLLIKIYIDIKRNIFKIPNIYFYNRSPITKRKMVNEHFAILIRYWFSGGG
jgi:hypothetical protein